MAYELPVKKGQIEVALSNKGVLYKGECLDYRAIARLVCSDEEVEIVFRDRIPKGYEELAKQKPQAFSLEYAKRKPVVVLIEPECSHQLPDMVRYIEAFMSQLGTAVWSEDRETILNAPEFDTRKIHNDLASAFTVGIG